MASVKVLAAEGADCGGNRGRHLVRLRLQVLHRSPESPLMPTKTKSTYRLFYYP